MSQTKITNTNSKTLPEEIKFLKKKESKSKYNKDTSYIFKTPGIYAYWCTPHKSMGMIGFVVVGEDKSNLDKIKAIKFVGKSKKIAPELISQL